MQRFSFFNKILVFTEDYVCILSVSMAGPCQWLRSIFKRKVKSITHTPPLFESSIGNNYAEL